MARTCPASSVNATIRAGVSTFDAACQQRGAKRTARERSGNAAGFKPRAGKYGSDGSTTRASPKRPSGGFFSARRLLRRRTMRPLASIASRIASRSQPAWHLTAIFPSRSSLTPHDAVLSSWAGQRKSCQPDADGAPDPPKARAISLAANFGAGGGCDFCCVVGRVVVVDVDRRGRERGAEICHDFTDRCLLVEA